MTPEFHNRLRRLVAAQTAAEAAIGRAFDRAVSDGSLRLTRGGVA